MMDKWKIYYFLNYPLLLLKKSSNFLICLGKISFRQIVTIAELDQRHKTVKISENLTSQWENEFLHYIQQVILFMNFNIFTLKVLKFKLNLNLLN